MLLMQRGEDVMRAIIFANGLMQGWPEKFDLFPDADVIIAADGGLKHCTDKGIVPLLVIGDMDSADPAELIALDAWRILGCRDAGRIDLRCDAAGNPQFIEVNPLAGIHPEHSDLPIICTKKGISYRDLIEEIVQSAAARI